MTLQISKATTFLSLLAHYEVFGVTWKLNGVRLVCAGDRVVWAHIDGFGGLVVSMLASGTRVRGFEPEVVGFFGYLKKIIHIRSFGGEVKESVPSPRFAACKRT